MHCVSPYREKHTHTKPYIKQSLHLGFGNFNQRLDKTTLPTGRQSFTFGAFFNQSLDNKTFQSLIFGFIYIYSLQSETEQHNISSRSSKIDF